MSTEIDPLARLRDSEHPHFIQVDRRRFPLPLGCISGAEIRGLVGRGEEWAVWRHVPGAFDRPVADGEVILPTNGMWFFTAPKIISPGAPDPAAIPDELVERAKAEIWPPISYRDIRAVLAVAAAHYEALRVDWTNTGAPFCPRCMYPDPPGAELARVTAENTRLLDYSALLERGLSAHEARATVWPERAALSAPPPEAP